MNISLRPAECTFSPNRPGTDDLPSKNKQPAPLVSLLEISSLRLQSWLLGGKLIDESPSIGDPSRGQQGAYTRSPLILRLCLPWRAAEVSIQIHPKRAHVGDILVCLRNRHQLEAALPSFRPMPRCVTRTLFREKYVNDIFTGKTALSSVRRQFCFFFVFLLPLTLGDLAGRPENMEEDPTTIADCRPNADKTSISFRRLSPRGPKQSVCLFLLVLHRSWSARIDQEDHARLSAVRCVQWC